MVKPEVARALTDPSAFEKASDATRQECWTHIHEAIAEIQAGTDDLVRRRMLMKLPPHIQAIVKEWVAAFWGKDVYAVAPDDAEVVRLPLAGIVALVRKKGAVRPLFPRLWITAFRCFVVRKITQPPMLVMVWIVWLRFWRRSRLHEQSWPFASQWH